MSFFDAIKSGISAIFTPSVPHTSEQTTTSKTPVLPQSSSGSKVGRTSIPTTQISPKSPSGSKSGGVTRLDNQVTSVCEHVFAQPDGQIPCYIKPGIAPNKKGLVFSEIEKGIDKEKIEKYWSEERIAILELKNGSVQKIFVGEVDNINIRNTPITEFFLYNKELKKLKSLPMTEEVTIDYYYQPNIREYPLSYHKFDKQKNQLIDEFCPKENVVAVLKIPHKDTNAIKKEIYPNPRPSINGKKTYIVQESSADVMKNKNVEKCYYIKKRMKLWPFFKNKEQCAFAFVPCGKDIDSTKLENIRDRRAIVWLNTNKDGRVEEMAMSTEYVECLDKQNIKDFFVCHNEQLCRILTRMPMTETVKVKEINDNEYDRRTGKIPQMALTTTSKVYAHSLGYDVAPFLATKKLFTIHYPRNPRK
jgi:hypothetical protein